MVMCTQMHGYAQSAELIDKSDDMSRLVDGNEEIVNEKLEEGEIRDRNILRGDFRTASMVKYR